MVIIGAPVHASALIYLAKSGGLSAACACFGGLVVSPAVWREVVAAGARRGSPEVPDVLAAENSGLLRRVEFDATARKRADRIGSQFGLGAGESEALTLGAIHGVVLLDEHRATRACKALGVATIETLLVPALCVQARVLDVPAAIALLHALARHTTVRADMVLRVEQLIEEARP